MSGESGKNASILGKSSHTGVNFTNIFCATFNGRKNLANNCKIMAVGARFFNLYYYLATYNKFKVQATGLFLSNN